MRVALKVIYASVGIVLVSVLMKLWLFDVIIKFGIRDQISLRKRNEVRDLYLKVPFPLNFKVYFFNVSNPMEIQQGAKPIVKEIGPYWYDEFKEKIDVEDNDMEDSLTYTPYDIYKFNQNKSGSLNEDDNVTVLNPIMVGMVNQVAEVSPVFLSIVNSSLQHLFNNPNSIFLTTSVKNILFDGMEINCKGKDFGTTAICPQIKSKIPDIKVREGDKQTYLFSLLGLKNGTKTNRIKVLRGIKNSKDVGKLVEANGKKELTIWSTTECNRFTGTDGWIFPPLLEPEDGFKAFSTDLCRNLHLSYVNDTVMKGVNVRLYEANLGDQSTNDEDKCYCPTPDTCLKKGLYDLTKCMGVPILLSLPHLLEVDESYLSKIEGLEPDDNKHGLRAFVEPMTSTPLWAAKRAQFNFQIQANKKVLLFANLPTALFPLLWLEEGVDLEGDILKKIQGVFLLLKIADVMLYITIAFGIISLAVAIYYHQKNKKEVTITPVYEIKKNGNGRENNDMQTLTKRSGTNEKIGRDNPVMTGHDRY